MSFTKQETELWKRIQKLKNIPRRLDFDGLYKVIYGDNYYPELYNQLWIGYDNPKGWVSVTLMREGFEIDGDEIITPPRLWKECNYPLEEKHVQAAKDLQKYLEESSIISETFGNILKGMKEKGMKSGLHTHMLAYKMSIAHAAIQNAGFYIKRRGSKNGRQTYWITKNGKSAGSLLDNITSNDPSEFWRLEAANRPHQKLARKLWG